MEKTREEQQRILRQLRKTEFNASSGLLYVKKSTSTTKKQGLTT